MFPFGKKDGVSQSEKLKLEDEIKRLREENMVLEAKLKVRQIIDRAQKITAVVLTKPTFEVLSANEKLKMIDKKMTWENMEIVVTNNEQFADGVFYFISEYEKYTIAKGVKG